MPEAVIVDAIRTPIGRAVKGRSRTSARTTSPPSRSRRSWSATPASTSPRPIDIMMGCGFQVGEQGYNVGRNAALLAGHRPSRPRHHGQPLLRLVAADDPHGLPRDQGRRGRPVHRRRRRGRLARPRRTRRSSPHPQARRLRGLAVRRLHPDGHDGRERRRALQGQPRGAGRVGGDLAEPRGRRARRRATSTRRSSPVTTPDGTEVAATTARGPARRSRSSPRSSRPSSPRRHGHGRQRLPAQRRRRRGARHVRGEGEGARPQAAGAHHRLLGRRDPARRSWASARSRRSRRCSSRPA